MTPETINLLIGGGIAIAASILTAIISHIFQARRENQKHLWELDDKEQQREWELKDRWRNEGREIYLKRIYQIEEYGTNIVKWATRLKERFSRIYDKQSYFEYLEEPGEVGAFLNNLYIRGIANELGDVELLSCLNKLENELSQFVNTCVEATQLFDENDDETTLKILDRIRKFPVHSVVDPYGEFLRRIDYLKNNIDTLFLE